MLTPKTNFRLPNYRYCGTGIEWAQPLEEAILENLDQMDCVEIIPENFFYGKNYSFLKRLGESGIPVAVHGVELSLGTVAPFKESHFEQMLGVLDEVNVVNFSEHLSITEAGGIEIGALTPLQWNQKTLDHVCRNVEMIQKRIEKYNVPFSLENVSYRFTIPHQEMTEQQFINRIQERTGCSLLLDITNVYTNSINFKFNPYEWLDQLDLTRVALVHLAGGQYDPEGFLKDSHDFTVQEDAWKLFEYLCQKTTPGMTIVERTDNCPEISELLLELRRADAILAGSSQWNRPENSLGAL